MHLGPSLPDLGHCGGVPIVRPHHALHDMPGCHTRHIRHVFTTEEPAWVEPDGAGGVHAGISGDIKVIFWGEILTRGKKIWKNYFFSVLLFVLILPIDLRT